MNNINGVNGYGRIPALGPQNSLGNTQNSSRQVQANPEKDQVEISSIAHYLSKISSLPDIRAEKVNEIRQQLDAGTYDVDGKLSEAIDNLLDEYIS